MSFIWALVTALSSSVLAPLRLSQAHGSGFGVREEGEPATQRVLLNDVSGQAVLALLQYLYTARCSVPAALRAHVLELASRSVCTIPAGTFKHAFRLHFKE